MIFSKSTIIFWLVSLAISTFAFAIAVYFKGGWSKLRENPRQLIGTGLLVYGIGINAIYLYHYHFLALTMPLKNAISHMHIDRNYHMDAWFYLLAIGISLIYGWMLPRRTATANLE